MPKNKNAGFRFRVLDRCLKDKNRIWTIDKLIDELSSQLEENFGISSVSERTIKGDFNIMRSDPPRGYGAPIVVENGYYFYDDPEFSIHKVPLNETDTQNMNEAIAILKQFGEFPFCDELQGLITKIESATIPLIKNDKPYLLLDVNNNVKGNHFLKPLYYFIKEKQIIEINYFAFNKEKEEVFIVHPYFLKEYNNRWYIVGWNESMNKITNLALDRIISLKKRKSKSIFIDKYRTNALEMFDKIIGVTLPEDKKTETIELWLDPILSPYFLTKPIHHSQQTIHSDSNGTIISLQLVVNRELVKLILSNGCSIKVIEPQSLQQSIIEEIEKSLKNYSER